MKTKYSLLKSLIVLSAICCALSYDFVSLTDLTEPAAYMASAVVGESVFFVGGTTDINSSPRTLSSSVREFNARTKTWTSHPNFQYAISGHCAVSDGLDNIYVFGGYRTDPNYENLFVRGTYSISNQQWTYGIAPSSLIPGTCVWNSDTKKVHLFNALNPDFDGYWIYDPISDIYTNGTKPPTIVYQSGGVGVFQDSTLYLASYNLTKYANDVWTKLQIPLGIRFFTTGFSTAESIWMLGGMDLNGDASATIQRYDIASDAWSSDGTLPQPIQAHNAALIGPSAFIFGGLTASNSLSAAVLMIPCMTSCPANTQCETYTCNITSGMCDVEVSCVPTTSVPTATPTVAGPTSVPVTVPTASNTPTDANSPVNVNVPANPPSDATTPEQTISPIDMTSTPQASPMIMPVPARPPSSSPRTVLGGKTSNGAVLTASIVLIATALI